MGVSKNRDTPKWMVYNGKPYEQMDDLGVPLFLETPRTQMTLVLIGQGLILDGWILKIQERKQVPGILYIYMILYIHMYPRFSRSNFAHSP